MAGRGLCKVILIGNLGQDPEVRYMPQGGAVANLSIATSESWRDKTTSEMKEQTEWHRVVIYQRLAEIAGEYLRKGSKVYIEGKLKTRKWTDKQDVERYTTEIVANEIQLLDGRNDNHHTGTPRDQVPPRQVQKSGEYQPIDTVPPRPRPVQELPPAMEPPIDFTDDIPF